MTGSSTNLQDAIDNYVQQAQQRSAKVTTSATVVGARQIQANVAVTNLAEYKDAQGKTQQSYQPHYQVITAQNQVQIYEELNLNADGKFTTNFTRRDVQLKDNRLLPAGWTTKGPDPSLNGRYLHSTFPEGNAVNDPDYKDGKAGTDNITYRITLPAGVDPRKCRVEATLYY